MCKCCDEIAFWKKSNKEKQNSNLTSKIFVKLSIYTWRKDERKIKGNQSSTITTKAYDLNYCPMCGRKLKE